MKTITDAINGLANQIYSNNFLALIDFVMPHECEFEPGHYGDYDFIRTEHDPNDPGGTTKYGLDAASHPHVDIENLKFDEAVAQYFSEIWQPLRGEDIPAQVAISMCDAAINVGSARSVRWLQTIVNASADGNIGNETVAAINAADPVATAQALNARRDVYYKTEVRESLRDEYLRGWEARVTDLNAFVNAETAELASEAQPSDAQAA
jgi:lysozyme family protein